MLYVLYRTVSAQQTKHLPKTLPKTMPFLPKVYVRVASKNRILAHMTDFYVIVDLRRLMQVFCIHSTSFKLIPACVYTRSIGKKWRLASRLDTK